MESGSWLERGEELLARRRVGEAMAAFDAAAGTCRGDDLDRCDGGRWLAAMLAGEFGLAWGYSDALRARGAPDPHRFWDGAALGGRRVIVRCLHGFGDAVQMLQYAPSLAGTAAEVVFEVAPRFVELAGYFRGVERVVTWGEAAPAVAPAWESQVEVTELPYVFRTMLEELPVARGYLELPEAVVETAAQRMGERPVRAGGTMRVGVVWAGGVWNVGRSVPLEVLSAVFSVRGCEFWNLQGDEAALEGRGKGLRDAPGDGLAALAGAIANLDLVITVDTLAAHLAGAMGKPVWVMLQYAADWRWMVGREDSPWYPSMRLFRQGEPGDWAGVVTAVHRALRAALLRWRNGEQGWVG